MLIIFFVFFIISFSFLLFIVLRPSKTQAHTRAAHSEVLRFDGRQIPGVHKETKVRHNIYFKSHTTSAHDLVNALELVSGATEEIRRKTGASDGQTQDEVGGGHVDKAMVKGDGTSIAADSNISREEKVKARAAAPSQIVPGPVAIVKVTGVQQAHAVQIDGQLVTMVRMPKVVPCIVRRLGLRPLGSIIGIILLGLAGESDARNSRHNYRPLFAIHRKLLLFLYLARLMPLTRSAQLAL
jgi:hypothetical protein